MNRVIKLERVWHPNLNNVSYIVRSVETEERVGTICAFRTCKHEPNEWKWIPWQRGTELDFSSFRAALEYVYESNCVYASNT